ncbi:MAG: efflux RND transporter permease subunit [Ruminiclostridium sp.]|nr:efflux RND transporter permease subunit [Ruminiclostridium sp.]
MNITELSVKRPTAIVMLIVLLAGVGVVGFMNLGANFLPASNVPIVTISSLYPGAGSEEIEKDIIKPFENAVAGVSGIDRINSVAGDGYGYTIVMFKMSADANTSLVDTQKAIDGIMGKLPQEATAPVIRKIDLNAEPVLTLAVSGGNSYEELYSKADKLKKSLENVSGIGDVAITGAQEKELSIALDKMKLEEYGIGVNTVISLLRAENINMPAGTLREDTRNRIVRVKAEFANIEQIKDLRIPVSGGAAIRLGDIADIELKYPEAKEITRLNGVASIGLEIKKQSDANIVETANLAKAQIEKFKNSEPGSVNIVIAEDSTYFINTSLDETTRNILEGILTTTIILLLFLRRWRSSLIVLIAIPTSIISTFFMMYMFKFTFNIVSLLGIAMCVGILVDDSIVILENIDRHIKMGKAPKVAAIDGRREIGLAAVAITLCDVVVFAPVAFMTDLVGQFLKEFGLTVVFATLFSLLVSFTLTPMMAAFMNKEKGHTSAGSNTPKRGMSLFDREVKKNPDKNDEAKPGRVARLFDRIIIHRYRQLLIWSLGNRWKIIGLVAAGIAVSVSMIPAGLIQAEFLPVIDQGKLTIDMNLTSWSTLKQTQSKVEEVEDHLKSLPEVTDYLVVIGARDNAAVAKINVKLTGKNQRKKTQTQLAAEIRDWSRKLTDVELTVTEGSILERTSIDSAKPIAINLTGPDPDMLQQIAKDVEKAVKEVPGTVDVTNSMNARRPDVSVVVDKIAAAGYGVTSQAAAALLRIAIEGVDAGVFRNEGNEYNIKLRFKEDQVKTVGDIRSIMLVSSYGTPVELGKIASIKDSDSPREITRKDRQQLVMVTSNIQGRVQSGVVKDIQEKLTGLDLPYGYAVEYGGDQGMMNTSFSALIKALIASVILVYMVLVVLYESYLTPVIRMLSLPCGIIGALLAMAIFGKAMNIMALIGVIMLDGIASKNGTLLIDYTNTLMKRGLPLREALLEAGVTRIRPIIMTSVTMIFGMLPVALSYGNGSEMKSGMALVLIGGLAASTILTPLVIPVVYTLIDDLRKKISNNTTTKVSKSSLLK